MIYNSKVDVNPLCAKFPRGNINIYLHFMSLLHIDMTKVVEILAHARQGPAILHSQYHCCWWPGDARSHSISNHDIYYVEPDQFGPRTLRVNSPPPSATYMHQWTGSVLARIMACCLVGAKPLSAPMLEHYQFDPWNKIQLNINQNSYIFIEENIFEQVVCEMGVFCPEGDELSNWNNSYRQVSNIRCTLVGN